jgi:hypothetical protein
VADPFFGSSAPSHVNPPEHHNSSQNPHPKQNRVAPQMSKLPTHFDILKIDRKTTATE